MRGHRHGVGLRRVELELVERERVGLLLVDELVERELVDEERRGALFFFAFFFFDARAGVAGFARVRLRSRAF